LVSDRHLLLGQSLTLCGEVFKGGRIGHPPIEPDRLSSQRLGQLAAEAVKALAQSVRPRKLMLGVLVLDIRPR